LSSLLAFAPHPLSRSACVVRVDKAPAAAVVTAAGSLGVATVYLDVATRDQDLRLSTRRQWQQRFRPLQQTQPLLACRRRLVVVSLSLSSSMLQESKGARCCFGSDTAIPLCLPARISALRAPMRGFFDLVLVALPAFPSIARRRTTKPNQTQPQPSPENAIRLTIKEPQDERYVALLALG